MEAKSDSLFQLNEQTIEKVKYIKLDKKADYSVKEINFHEIDRSEYQFVDFYSFGFYDSMTCIIPKSISYREHFLISYPYPRTANALKTEQWFGIFPLATKKLYTNILTEKDIIDPFFCFADLQQHLPTDSFFCATDLQSYMPFVGVILISLSKCDEDFNTLLTNYVNYIDEKFKENSNEKFNVKSPGQSTEKPDEKPDEKPKPLYIAEIYYSLNCADLCLAIRTDSLPFIHTVNRTLGEIAETYNYDINTTVVFSVQNRTDMVFLENLSPKNADVSFVVRSNTKLNQSSENADISFEDCSDTELDQSNHAVSYGVNGIGKYVTTLSFDKYIQYLPDIFAYKLNHENVDSSSFARSICHERQWFNEKEQTLNESNRNTYCSSKEKMENLQDSVLGWTNDIVNLINDIEKKSENLFTHRYHTLTYKETFSNEFRMIKELFLTYSDLWYQDASECGWVFFAQLWIALKGLNAMIVQSNHYCKKDDREALVESIQALLKANHNIVCDLNGHNKQFQFLNQDSVNFPSYEIQSKVNSQKYMAAYCSFLHRLFANYYHSKQENEKIVQNFPIALVDINQRKIIANIFFTYSYTEKTKADNHCNRTIFSVHFPSSQYFSNVWSSIPLLMHEASHTQHYGKVEKRNRALLYSVDKFFADIIVKKLVKIVNDGVFINTSSILIEQLKAFVYDSIVELRKRITKGSTETLSFNALVKYCKLFYHGIFDKEDIAKGITYSGLPNLEKKLKTDVEYILQIIGFNHLCYAFYKATDFPKSLYYFLNTLFLEFNSDFYQRYKSVYDDDFLNDLIREIKNAEAISGENDDPDVILLRLTLYRLMKYVQHDHSVSFAGNTADAVYIAFEITVIAGMNAIFSKYSGSFSKSIANSISRKTYFKNLVPEINTESVISYNDKLEKAFQEFIYSDNEEGHIKSVSPNDQYLMESMLSEYYELYISINHVVKFMTSDNNHLYNAPFSATKDFVKLMHGKCSSYINEVECKENTFKTIFTKSNREQLIKMGFFEDGTDIIESVFSTVMSECNNTFVNDMITDRSVLFQEIYADCGMCTSIGFDPFGYCMFTMSVRNVVNDIPSDNFGANLLADRTRAILMIYLNGHKDAIKLFLQKLMDVKMLSSICITLTTIKYSDTVKQICDEAQQKINAFDIIENIKFSKKTSGEPVSDKTPNNEMSDNVLAIMQDISTDLRWWVDDIVGVLIIAIEDEYEQGIFSLESDKIALAKSYLLSLYNVIHLLMDEEVLTHINVDDYEGFFSYLQELMQNSNVFANVHADECVKEIREFYNLEFPNHSNSKFEDYYLTYAKGFINQCNFIFNRYCDYRNSYYHLIREIINVPPNGSGSKEIGDWFDIIDQYYLSNDKEAEKTGV